MKSCKITTRSGTFKILLAVKGPRNAEPKALKHALAIACNRIMRSERRQSVLRDRRAHANVVPLRRKPAAKRPARKAGAR